MKHLITIAIVCAATLAWAGTATKEYVDRRDAETLAESKAYTDAHAGGGDFLPAVYNPSWWWQQGDAFSVSNDVQFEHSIFLTDWSCLNVGLFGSSIQHLPEYLQDNYASIDALGSLSSTVDQWTTYWDGDDVRVTITNYYGSLALPSLYLEQRMHDDVGGTNYFKVVWNEMTRWNDFLGGYSSVTNELAQKADRAWGFYDSATGEYSPEDFLQISTPNVILANGMAYQKTITTGGCSMWVLKSTQPTTISGETEQGFFRITDGDGNALFEIVKGDKRVVGATATALTMDGGSMVITYPVTGDQPTLSVCSDLKSADWQTGDDITVATVSWSGGSGNWVATVTPVGPRPSLFAKASYEVGGNTYIKNNVATSIDKVVVGGHEYTVTVETVNGKKLLVLQ